MTYDAHVIARNLNNLRRARSAAFLADACEAYENHDSPVLHMLVMRILDLSSIGPYFTRTA